jgi:alpha-N-arabinofuranosidase
LGDVKATKAVGEVLTAKNLTDYNSFEQPDVVKPVAFNNAKISKGMLTVKLPAKSIVTIELQ